MRTDSVISSSNLLADIPDAARALMTTGSSLPPINWVGERLTATLTPSGQVAASAQACRSTHSPREAMSPFSSATGINSVGSTIPRSGWCQRSRASQPLTWLAVSYTHLRAHETVLDLVCRLLLE